MKPTLVINDLHLGVTRVAGTTQESARQLRAYLQDAFVELLDMAPGRVVINGDLTDQFDIPLGEALDIYAALDGYMSKCDTNEVLLALGNHDLSKDSSKLGTVQFVGSLLEMKYPERFGLISRPTTFDGMHIIPHLVNQAHFDMALEQVPDGVRYVLLHANYDNNFATEADHSLNVSREQAKALIDRGMTLVFGHEHQGRRAFGGGVIVVGNQFPSSVVDCMSHGDGQLDGKKRALLLTDGPPQTIQTWCQEGNSVAVKWDELAAHTGPEKFIRVTGRAEAEQAADVIKAISTFRQKSDAFVVTNAVKVAQVADAEEMEVSAEDVRSVNVIDMLLESLTEEQAAVVRQLMEKN